MPGPSIRAPNFTAAPRGISSDGGNAGGGLYGVGPNHISFAEQWGEDPKRVVAFRVNDTVKIVDITEGEGERVFDEFKAHYHGAERIEDAFASYFGVDILRYPYERTVAFVVKNSAALSKPRGHKVELMSFTKLSDRAAQVHDDAALDSFFSTIKLNQVSTRELKLLLATLAEKSPSATPRSEVTSLLAVWNGAPAPNAFEPWMEKLLPKLVGQNSELDEVLVKQVFTPLLEKGGATAKKIISLAHGSKKFYEDYFLRYIGRHLFIEHFDDLPGDHAELIGRLNFHGPASPEEIAFIEKLAADPDPKVRAAIVRETIR